MQRASLPEPEPFPRWSFLSAVAITLAVFAVLGSGVERSYRVVRGFEEVQLATENVCGRITWLDEVLTMSARMAAATGDSRWQERYDESCALLDEAIAEAHRLAPGEEEDEAARQTDEANQALVAMELESFERVAAGDHETAWLLLTSDDYERNKRIYAGGMDRFLAAMRARTSELLAAERTRTKRATALLALSVPALLVLWVVLGRSLLAHRRSQLAWQRALREHNAAIERGRREVEAAMDAKGEFLARMSHEIRTPMNGVLGLSELLAETGLDDEQRDLVRTIQSSGAMLLSIIDDVLDLSKIEAGMLRVAPVPSDPRRLVRDVLAILAGRARLKGVELTCEIADDVPECVSLDPTRVRQVLTNLAGNAIKFTEEGGVTVRLETQRDAGDVHGLVLEVRDTGVGIAPEALEGIFESFVQADDTVGRRFGGTGLGLTISRELVRAMGGSISVESEPGEGTCFTVRLPAPQVEGAGAAASDGPEEPERRWDARVLVVEDNAVNQLVARRLIERTGCRVDAVNDGLACLARLEQTDYDLVFMDCGMPVLDGFETTRRIRATEGDGRRLPVVALTASAFPGDVQACKDAGMDDFLSKPFELEQIRAMLLRWVGPPAALPGEPAARDAAVREGS